MAKGTEVNILSSHNWPKGIRICCNYSAYGLKGIEERWN
jgi:hypothetical protein